MARHASKSYQNELDQRLSGLSQETRDRRKLAALARKSELFPSYMKATEKQLLKRLQTTYGIDTFTPR